MYIHLNTLQINTFVSGRTALQIYIPILTHTPLYLKEDINITETKTKTT